MEEILKGNIVHAPRLGELSVTEKGCMALRDGIIQGIYQEVPEAYRNAPVTDYGDALIMQSFADMHLHAPQYPMLGMGMDLPLLDWLTPIPLKQKPASRIQITPAGSTASWPPTSLPTAPPVWPCSPLCIRRPPGS